VLDAGIEERIVANLFESSCVARVESKSIRNDGTHMYTLVCLVVRHCLGVDG
jgi:hypothetical protein